MNGMSVCLVESEVWRSCLWGADVDAASVSRPCRSEESDFIMCVDTWRSSGGGGQTRVKGTSSPSEAPPQCKNIATLFSQCEWRRAKASPHEQQREHAQTCSFMMQAFKTCTKAMFLSEWVV